jgi:outer membrane protein assembly factor BamD
MALARRLMEQRHYTNAIDLLKTYIDTNAGSADIDAAIYLLGQCYLRTKEWASASAEFERLLRDYPESDSSGAGSFALGDALFGQARGPDFDQEETTKAVTQWQSYLDKYPGHWLNDEARRRIALARSRLATKLVNAGNLYLKLKLPGPAIVYFSKVVQEYSDSPQLGEALIGLARAKAMSGKRDEAIQSLKELEAQFPGKPIAGQAARERARLERN